MKKILSVILSALLLAASVNASPSMAPAVESTVESTNEDFANSSDNADGAVQDAKLMQAAVIENTDEEETNEKPSNILTGDASLMLEIYDGGDGTAASPYQISTVAQLEYFAQSVNSGMDTERHFILTSDIDLEGAQWVPVGFYSKDTQYSCTFKGSFDGNGHTVSNFKVEAPDTPYAGFFGLIFNGEVKNLTIDNATVDIERFEASTTTTYAGVLAGRVVADGIGGKCVITNCHVKNSSVKLVSDKHAYAGGLVGFSVAGNYTDIDVFGVSADCAVTVQVSATSYSSNTSRTPYVGAGAGLFGYFGSLTDSRVSLRASHSKGEVSVDNSSSQYVNTFAGGFFGQAATRVTNEVGGNAVIFSNYSTSNVSGKGQLVVFAGGFAGNMGATANMLVTNCYASGDTTASSTYNYSAIGGFVGQLDFENYADSMGKPFSLCYASGDAIDTRVVEGNGLESYVGGFVGYSFAPVFDNCYVLESQTVTGVEAFSDSGILTVSSDAAASQEGYPAFDFENVWNITPEAEYSYPTLEEIKGFVTFYSEEEVFGEAYFGESGKITVPAINPEKADTAEWDFTFSYWSNEENGEPVDFENTVFSENSAVFAVFTAVKRTYNVSFVSEGESFGEALTLVYGSLVQAPEAIPEKAETQKYRYVFDGWALSPAGEKVNISDLTVTKDYTFYALYIEVDKTAWQGGIATKFSEGHGTSSLPYIISSADELALLAKVINEGDTEYTSAYYKLGADINLGYNHWTPIGTEDKPFSAKFDGSGYSISCFKLAGADYMGLFGYVKSATIKNTYISDFEIDINGYSSSANVYAGGLAGYITCYRTNTVIDGIYVNASKFSIEVSAPELYAGNLAGYVNSRAAKSLVSNSYATSNITVTNTNENGTACVGGLAGYMYTYASALAKASNCYYVGSVSASAYLKCIAGGLAGSLSSWGSAFSPPVSTSLAADDKDIMFENSFVNANVSATILGETQSAAYAGAITGELTDFAGISNVFFKRSNRVYSTGTVNTLGISCSETNLLSKNFVADTVKFDFTNVWTYVGSNKYPSLKSMYSDKPILRINNLEYSDGVLSASVTAYAKSSSYTVIVGVYNERNQLIATRRVKLGSSDLANEFDVTFDNLSEPVRVKVSVIDSLLFVPLFSPVEWFI